MTKEVKDLGEIRPHFLVTTLKDRNFDPKKWKKKQKQLQSLSHLD